MVDRRVTRSLSNELQARAAAQAQAQTQRSVSNSYVVQNAQSHSQQHNSSGGQRQQHQRHQDPSSADINQYHHQQQQALGGMNSSGVGGAPSAAFPRTISDEIFLTTLMNTPVSPGTPIVDAALLGFMDGLQPPQTQRGDSEELFNSWIATSTPENSNQYHNNVYFGPSSTGNRPRQNSRRMSSELQAILAQQSGALWALRADNVEQQQAYLQTNSLPSDGIISNVKSDQKSYRTNVPEDKSATSDLLKNTWFSATSPMTRSRSSELRRRYAQLEGLSSPSSADVLEKLANQGTLEGLVNQPSMTSMGTFSRAVGSMQSNHRNSLDSKQMGVPQVPLVATMSSSAPLNHKLRIQHQPPAATGSGLSDVVGLLKGSLERKKMQKRQQQQQQQQQEPRQGLRYRPTQEPPHKGVMGKPVSMSSPQISGHRPDESLNISQDHRQYIHGDSGLMGPVGQLGKLGQIGQLKQQDSLGRAHSPDGSSCGAPCSAGIATSDGPSNSGMSVHRQAFKRGSGAVVDQPSPKHQAFSGMDSGCPSNGENYESGPKKASSLQKPDHLTRAGSITSSLRTGFQLNEIDGATKKRRVERQRKMAEAKGRGNGLPMPADMQAALKRCDALEKEVRSLKLNLSFMNRKDSEQTKKIEQLEQQNENLKEERDKLLEELDQIFGVHDQQ